MTLDIALLILVGILLVMLFSGLEVAFALGLTGIIGFYLFAGGTRGLLGIGTIAWQTLYSNEIAALPLFILMGEVFLLTGISDHLYRAVTNWFGRLPGALASASIAAAAGFSAITGSSAACAATIGTVAVPEMLKRGYDPKLTFGTLVSGGALGPLIPPSIAMIIYALVTEQSIIRLFLGGAIPGIILTFVFIAYITVIAILRPHLAPRPTGVSWREKLFSSIHLVPIIGIILLVLGGIYTGIFSVTEAAAIGAASCYIVALIYGRLTPHVLRETLYRTMLTTCFVLMIVVGAMILSHLVTYLGLPQRIVEVIDSLGVSRWIVFALLCLMYLVMGCFLEAISTIMITVPVLFPVIVALGFDPIWFGVTLVILIEIGMLTPPVGINLYIIHGVSEGHPMSEVILGSVPFVFLWLFGLALVVIFPSLALWLPNTLLGG